MKEQQQPDRLKKVKPLRDSHTEDMVDHYWGSINYVTSLIKASELKAGLILSFYGILLNFIYQSVEKLFLSESTEIVLYVLIGLWFSITATSIFFCVRCFIPKIEGNYDNNVLFFGDVINKYGSIKEFSKTFYEISQDEEVIFQQMGEQIYINSKIAAWKFSNVAWAIRLLGIGLLLLLGIVFYFVVITI